jgi:hypothetical protein
MLIFQSRKKENKRRKQSGYIRGVSLAFGLVCLYLVDGIIYFYGQEEEDTTKPTSTPLLTPPLASLLFSCGLSLLAASLDLIHNLYFPHHHHHHHHRQGEEEEDTLHQHSLKPREFS